MTTQAIDSSSTAGPRRLHRFADRCNTGPPRRWVRSAAYRIQHTVVMNSVWFGRGIADDREFRLCGDVAGKRVIELGVTPSPPPHVPNAITLALAGAKSICVDPSAERIAALRQCAADAGVRVECHRSDLADLGFVASASMELVLATQTLDDIDDLPRLLRQVHRVLRSEAAFVVSLTHPVAAIFDTGMPGPVRRYGSTARSIGELFMSFERSNFRLDAVHELTPLATRDALVPAVLVLRARKQGV